MAEHVLDALKKHGPAAPYDVVHAFYARLKEA